MDIAGFEERFRREKSWRFPTTKICVSALIAFRGKVEDYTVFKHPAMHEYLEGAKRIAVESTNMPDAWDPAVVVTALKGPPFEPLSTADMKWVSGKVFMLLLLTTAARVLEVTALTARVDFSVNDEQVIIYPAPEFRPKTKDDIYSRGPMVTKAFYLVIGSRGALTYPSRLERCAFISIVLGLSDNRNSSWYRIGNKSPGLPITPKRVSHWLVDTVVEAYTRARKPVPKLTVHSTRGVSTSVAALLGLSWEVICRTASWKSYLTSRQHYFRHVNVPSVGDVVLRQFVPQGRP